MNREYCKNYCSCYKKFCNPEKDNIEICNNYNEARRRYLQ